MDCSKNAFCGNLDEDVRRILCSSCRRSIAAAGSFRLHLDFESKVTVLLEGLILYSIKAEDQAVDGTNDVPNFFLSVPGHVLSTDMTYNSGDDRYSFTGVEMLTDCRIARIEHQVFRDALERYPHFATNLLLNLNTMLRDSCLMSSILRTSNTAVCVRRLIDFLTEQGAYLTQLQIASLVDRNRASVSRAVKAIREESPEKWERYVANKGRVAE